MSQGKISSKFEELEMLNLNIDIPGEFYSTEGSRHHSRKMERIPFVLREDHHEQNKHDYDPKVVSFGPFHHGKPELYLRGNLKQKSLEIFVSSTGKDERFFYKKILEEIDEIRGCYLGVSREDYDDVALAEMMLLDGCFIINHMEVHSDSEKLLDVLCVVGMLGLVLTARDMYLFENQIPFRVISLLVGLKYDRRKGEELIDKFLSFSAFQGRGMKHENVMICRGGKEPPPLHLLDGIRRTLVPETWSEPVKRRSSCSSIFKWLGLSRKEGKDDVCKIKKCVDSTNFVYTCRSVTDLKAKGIHFKPSSTVYLKDVEFRSHGLFYGELRLPVRFVSKITKSLFTNLIAYEICPNNVTDYAVSSYVNLMKSLIHDSEDVKELREQRILISDLSSDEEVVKVFKNINTYGMENAGIFCDVKEKIEKHYNSKARTWMAELVHTYFESPWSTIALFAAAFLLGLTFLQTLYTVHPPHLP